MKIVISQPMYFPWPGMLQQIKHSDIYIYYNDVQFSRGGFLNRVQIKTNSGIRWLTVPLLGWKLGQLINEVKIDNSQNWKQKHIEQLKQAYAKSPHKREMITLVENVLSANYKTIDELSSASTNALVDYYPEIGKNTQFFFSSSLNIQGVSTKRVLDICIYLNANYYLTGHGARNYLEHEKFEKEGLDVVYIDYGLDSYPQLHGEFTPYVSTLDLIANCGKEGLGRIQGTLVNWREFIKQNQKI